MSLQSSRFIRPSAAIVIPARLIMSLFVLNLRTFHAASLGLAASPPVAQAPQQHQLPQRPRHNRFLASGRVRDSVAQFLPHPRQVVNLQMCCTGTGFTVHQTEDFRESLAIARAVLRRSAQRAEGRAGSVTAGSGSPQVVRDRIATRRAVRDRRAETLSESRAETAQRVQTWREETGLSSPDAKVVRNAEFGQSNFSVCLGYWIPTQFCTIAECIAVERCHSLPCIAGLSCMVLNTFPTAPQVWCFFGTYALNMCCMVGWIQSCKEPTHAERQACDSACQEDLCCMRRGSVKHVHDAGASQNCPYAYALWCSRDSSEVRCETVEPCKALVSRCGLVGLMRCRQAPDALRLAVGDVCNNVNNVCCCFSSTGSSSSGQQGAAQGAAQRAAQPLLQQNRDVLVLTEQESDDEAECQDFWEKRNEAVERSRMGREDGRGLGDAAGS